MLDGCRGVCTGDSKWDSYRRRGYLQDPLSQPHQETGDKPLLERSLVERVDVVFRGETGSELVKARVKRVGVKVKVSDLVVEQFVKVVTQRGGRETEDLVGWRWSAGTVGSYVGGGGSPVRPGP
jgi:hypothetical protein